jgi:hypothetical protein
MRRWLSLFLFLFLSGPLFGQIGPPPTSWNGILNPTANKAFTMQNRTTSWTWTTATGASNLFNLTDSASNTAATGAFLRIAPAGRAFGDLNPIPLRIEHPRNDNFLPAVELCNVGCAGKFQLRTHDVAGGFSSTIVSSDQFNLYTGTALGANDLRIYAGGFGNRTMLFNCERASSEGADLGCIKLTNQTAISQAASNSATNINYRLFSVYSSTNEIATISGHGFAVNNNSFGGYSLYFYNSGTVGTTLGRLAKLDGATGNVRTPLTTDTTGVIGLCAESCGTTGKAKILLLGLTYCDFDASVTGGNYVKISSTTAGKCADAGATYPASGQVLGRVMFTASGAGTYEMYFKPER